MATWAPIQVDQAAPIVAAVGAVTIGDVLKVTGTGPVALGFAASGAPTVAVLAANFTSVANAWADATGLTLAVVAGTYLFTFVAGITNTGGGTDLAVNGPTLTELNATGLGNIPGTSVIITAYDTGFSTSGAAVWMQGTLRVSAAGTFAIRVQNTAGDGATITVQRGATLQLTKVA